MRIANATVVELHLEDFFALAQESRTPPRMELHFGRYLAHKPHPEGIVVWKISRSQTPPGWNCTLEDLSPLGESYKPRQGRIALWKIFHPCKNYKPHPGGIGLGRFFALTNPTRMELHFGGFFAQT